MAGPRNPKFMIGEIDGIEQDGFCEYEPQAEDVAFDPTGTDLTSTTVQDAIVEVDDSIAASASPGYSYGKSGNVTSGSWLERPGGPPSNKTGIRVGFNSPQIIEVSTASENLDTYTLQLYEHEGDETNLTTLGSVLTITASRGATFTLTQSMTSGRQLAVRLVSGSAKNIGVDVSLTGSFS